MSSVSSESETDFHSSNSSSSSELNEFSEVEKIIGINKQIIDKNDPTIKYYVKLKEQSYRQCEWRSAESISNLNPRLVNHFIDKCLNGLTPVGFIPDLYKPDSVDFDPDYLVPKRILAKKKDSDGNKIYLVQWKKLPIKDATWEKNVTSELKTEYKKILLSVQVPTRFTSKANPSLEFPSKFMEFKNNNVLKDYQYVGVQWLFDKWKCQKGCILADEMGLGKTIQALALIQTLKYWFKVKGPYLVICPLSTSYNWLSECEAWTNLNAIVFTGNEESRETIKKLCIMNESSKDKMKVELIIAPYDNVVKDISFFTKFKFATCIIDEAHRLKSYESKTYQILRRIDTYNSILLTGTPIQNNLKELISILHFIDPQAFPDIEMLTQKYNETNVEHMKELIALLDNYILRRKKETFEKSIKPKEEIIVNVELTHEQRLIYKLLLDDNRDILMSLTTSVVNFKNISMELRKICNHPYLNSAYELVVGQYKQRKNINREMTYDEEMQALVETSGKMILLDKLLPKLKEGGHKVLIFSQMTKVLDLIQSFLEWKHFHFERLDGSTSIERRSESIDRFSTYEDSFVFLLSTRAGGQGINLTAADTVIIYDSDWNPQNDIQAMARCHRIGQDKEVKIYRLITKNTYEEQMFDRASMKLGLDKVITDGFDENSLTTQQMDMMLRKGAYYILKDQDEDAIDKFCAEDIDQILTGRARTIKSDATDSNVAKVTFESSDKNEAVDFGADNFWSQFFTSNSDNLGTRRGARKAVKVFDVQAKIMKKKEFNAIASELLENGLIASVSQQNHGNNKEYNYKICCIIYFMCNSESKIRTYNKILKNIPMSQQITEDILDAMPFTDQLLMYNYFKVSDYQEIVDKIYELDKDHIRKCYASDLIQRNRFAFAMHMQVDYWWTTQHDYALIYSSHKSYQFVLQTLQEINSPNGVKVALPPQDQITLRANILLHELQAVMPKDFFTLEPPIHPSKFRDQMNTRFECMKECHVRRLMRAMFMISLSESFDVIVQKYCLLANFQYRIDVVKRYAKMILKKCNVDLPGVDLVDVSISEISWIPQPAIEALASHLKLMKNMDDAKNNVGSNLASQIDPPVNIKSLLPNAWSSVFTVCLFRYTTKNGFFSLCGLCVMPEFDRTFFINKSADDKVRCRDNELKTMTPRISDLVPSLGFLQNMQVWVGLIRTVLNSLASTNIFSMMQKLNGPAITILSLGKLDKNGVPVGYSAVRLIDQMMFHLSVANGPKFIIRYQKKIIEASTCSRAFAQLIMSLPPRDAEQLAKTDAFFFFGFRLNIFQSLCRTNSKNSV